MHLFVHSSALAPSHQRDFFRHPNRRSSRALLVVLRLYHSSSRVALWKHSTVHTRMKKDVNSMNMAPVSIRPACLRMAGIARLPMADMPVRNFATFIHLKNRDAMFDYNHYDGRCMDEYLSCDCRMPIMCSCANTYVQFSTSPKERESSALELTLHPLSCSRTMWIHRQRIGMALAQ